MKQHLTYLGAHSCLYKKGKIQSKNTIPGKSIQVFQCVKANNLVRDYHQLTALYVSRWEFRKNIATQFFLKGKKISMLSQFNFVFQNNVTQKINKSV